MLRGISASTLITLKPAETAASDKSSRLKGPPEKALCTGFGLQDDEITANIKTAE
jgi:hypothetical protein